MTERMGAIEPMLTNDRIHLTIYQIQIIFGYLSFPIVLYRITNSIFAFSIVKSHFPYCEINFYKFGKPCYPTLFQIRFFALWYWNSQPTYKLHNPKFGVGLGNTSFSGSGNMYFPNIGIWRFFPVLIREIFWTRNFLTLK